MSTKSTLLFGENYHLYREPFELLPILKVKNKIVDLPDDFREALLKLILLHSSCKSMIEYTTELDEIDGGLFSINMKTGKTGEFKQGKFREK